MKRHTVRCKVCGVKLRERDPRVVEVTCAKCCRQITECLGELRVVSRAKRWHKSPPR